MAKLVLLVAILLVAAQAELSSELKRDPPCPTWPTHFEQEFVESYLKNSTYKVLGYMWYDYGKKMSRIDRNNGKYDRVCSSVNEASTPCRQLVRDGKRYMVYPFIQYCCVCCDASHGCGVLIPNWPCVGFNYEGKDELSGQFFDKFRNPDEKTNYWVTEENQIPRKLSELDMYFRDHIMNTYKENPISEEIFKLPSYCSPDKLCPATSVCGKFRGEQPSVETQ